MPDVPPPGVGFVTDTNELPAVTMRVDDTVAVNVLLSTYEVINATPPHFTTDVGINREPVTVNVNVSDPVAIDAGSSDVAIGTGFVTLKFTPEETPPPGAGFETVTAKEPDETRSDVKISIETAVAER